MQQANNEQMLQSLVSNIQASGLKQKLIFTFIIIALFRFGAQLPIFGINNEVFQALAAGNNMIGFLDLFSGGALGKVSIFALGIGPYITASIIMQLLAVIVPYLENLQKRKENQPVINPGADASKISEDINDKLNDILNQASKKVDDTYSMSDLEADLAKLRLSVEKSNKNIGTDFQNIGGWLKNTNSRLENLSNMVGMLSKKIENTEKLGLEEVKTRLVQSERDYVAPQKIEETLNGVYKKYKIQEMRLEELDEKISLILQKQSEGFDVKSFIDLFYDNTTQTKSLASRVDNIENKLNTISKNIEKIISYIDE